MHERTSRLARFPFDPARLPFFYGWPILLAGTAGMVMSAPGQTVGVSVFTDFLLAELGIGRSALSLTYLVGTVASALTLARTGRLYDRFGARLVATVAALGLTITLLVLTVLPSLLGSAARVPPFVTFLAMAVGFWMLRYSGQGMLTLASRNMVMEWFDRRRGMANAVMGISLSFGFSVAPRVFEALIGADGDWQGAWRTIAVATGIFALVAFLLYRDRPEDHGMKPDGPLAGRATRGHAETIAGENFTLPEARRTYAFWVFAGTLFLAGLLITAYTFHIVSIFGDAGMSRSVAVSVFLPAAVVAVIVEFVGSWLSDYLRLKYLAIVQLTGAVLLSASLGLSSSGVWYLGVVAGHGLMQGMFGVLSNVTWPRFYGRRHLGAIAGFATSLTVLGTAIGPALFSLLRDVSGTYAPAAILIGVVGLILIVLALRADRPAAPTRPA